MKKIALLGSMMFLAACPPSDDTGDGSGALELEIAQDKSSDGDCATFQDGAWDVARTSFDDSGLPTNEACVLAPLMEDGLVLWLTSAAYEGNIGEDDLRHCDCTAEAVAQEGAVGQLELYDEADLDVAIYSGALNVKRVTTTSVTIELE